MFRRLAASLFCLAVLAPVAGARGFSEPPPAAAKVAPRPPPADRIRPDPAPVDPEKDQPAPIQAPTRAQVWRALARRRAHNLADFRRYRKRGVYPHNFVRSGPLNVWRDPEGHLCAAATMIDMDGQHALVQKVGDTQNNVRLLDVTSGPLMDWMLTSGLTIEEIDMIQEPMFRPSPRRVEEDPKWRMAEDRRLRKLYVRVEAYLVKHRRQSLTDAVDRLMAHPKLAHDLVEASL